MIFHKLGAGVSVTKRRLQEKLLDTVHLLQHPRDMLSASGGNRRRSYGELRRHRGSPRPPADCFVEASCLCAVLDGERAIDEAFRMILKARTGPSQGAEGSDIVDGLGDKIQNLVGEIEKLLGCFGHGRQQRRKAQIRKRSDCRANGKAPLTAAPVHCVRRRLKCRPQLKAKPHTAGLGDGDAKVLGARENGRREGMRASLEAANLKSTKKQLRGKSLNQLSRPGNAGQKSIGDCCLVAGIE